MLKINTSSVMLRIILIGILIALFMVPFSFVESVITDRQSYSSQAVTDVASGWASDQVIMGPIIVVPYTKKVAVQQQDAQGKPTGTTMEKRQFFAYILPETLSGKVDLTVTKLHKGIYDVPVYNAAIDLHGLVGNILPETTDSEPINIEQPYAVFRVSDSRGISDATFQWAGEKMALQSGTNHLAIPNGFHIMLPKLTQGQKSFNYTLSLKLKGMQTFNVLPVGKTTSIQMTSSWPDPSFEGRYLPATRNVSDKGFSATWDTGFLATNIEPQINGCFDDNGSSPTGAGPCDTLLQNYLGISLFQPVDIYQQSERSVKYGLLFVFLTFTAFFIFEILRPMLIHPVQYLLVGSGLVLFYLLLISLSEVTSFLLAYTIATVAIVGLLGFYVSNVMRSARSGLIFSGLMTALYIALYFILQSQDHALLMGSVMLFTGLALVMFLTRKINWYDIRRGGQAN